MEEEEDGGNAEEEELPLTAHFSLRSCHSSASETLFQKTNMAE